MNNSQLYGAPIFSLPTSPWVKLVGSPTQRAGCLALANFHNFSSQSWNSPPNKKIAPFELELELPSSTSSFGPNICLFYNIEM